MGFDHHHHQNNNNNNNDLSINTGLVLGLGFSSSSPLPTPLNNNNTTTSTLPKHGGLNLEPSLTLSLSDESYEKRVVAAGRADQHHHPRQPLCHQESAASSFSNVVNVKREREIVSEEVETTTMTTTTTTTERVCSRVSDEDEDGSNARKKLRLTKAQSALLEESFKLHSTLNPKQKQELARELSLRPRQVEVWFQNRRARTKLKQTEVDCEFLKKCCETLTDENRRLQKELQELKALKVTAQPQPLYMQLPAATLTMCPSCERIGGMGENGHAPPKSAFNIAAASKPHHFYNPFTNPSAAC